MSLVISKCRYCDRFNTAEHLAESKGWCGECAGPDKSEPSKPTPGPWGADYYNSMGWVVVSRAKGEAICAPGDGPGQEANASLIAEAGTVYHESGLMPRLMWEAFQRESLSRFKAETQRDELLVALAALLDVSACQNDCDPADMTCATNVARAAIAKAEGK